MDELLSPEETLEIIEGLIGQISEEEIDDWMLGYLSALAFMIRIIKKEEEDFDTVTIH